MAASLGRITARLIEPDNEVRADLVERINANVNPPAELSADDVWIRAMYIVSDQVNSFGGRFPAEEHQNLCRLLVDSPVMVGHRKDKLPVGRTFHAVEDLKDGIPWVKSYFYWLRNATGAADLRDNIDAGVYKECSIAFTFLKPECSVCGKDIRVCPHEPFEEYDVDNGVTRCHFNYRQVDKVLESSLVYRGAVPNTSVTRDLTVLDNPSADYYIVPHYDGLPVTARLTCGTVQLLDPNGVPLTHLATTLRQQDGITDGEMDALLVGYRGKQRCSMPDVRKHLDGQASPVSRLVCFVYPGQGVDDLIPTGEKTPLEFRLFPYRTSTAANLEQQALEIATRSGVCAWPSERRPTDEAARQFIPSQSVSTDQDCLEFMMAPENSARLKITWEDGTHQFLVDNFDAGRLRAGRMFVARRCDPSALHCNDRTSALRFPITSVRTINGGYHLVLATAPAAVMQLRPALLQGRACFVLRLLARTEDD
ncbi:MAG: hypothetical protein KKA42_14085 [candidate division Zixibacteria bacterium]|nr:hypothetical protein [candidate division Zixibacteria bacterium]